MPLVTSRALLTLPPVTSSVNAASCCAESPAGSPLKVTSSVNGLSPSWLSGTLSKLTLGAGPRSVPASTAGVCRPGVWLWISPKFRPRPIVAPTGSVSASHTVSEFSSMVSLSTSTSTVFTLSCGAKISVPLASR